MYGPDFYSTDHSGVIPRAARQVFERVRTGDIDIEYQLKCSMVEMYKENLRDLLFVPTENMP